MSTTHTPTSYNIIWVFGDQHRAQALGCAGDPNVHTPNLDRLAAEGVTFTAAVAGCPLSCPFRGSLLTSQYPHRCVPGHEHRLPETQKTIAHAFREQGYHTAYFGKWHVDGFQERTGRAAMHTIPRQRRGGFDLWLGYENNNSQWDSWVHGHDAAGVETPHFRVPGYETDGLTDMLIDYVRQRGVAGAKQSGASGRVSGGGGTQPFFAVLSVQPPHNPYTAPESWMQRHTPGEIALRPNVPAVPHIVAQARRDLAGYYAQIENLDWNVGRLRAALAEAGLAERTLLVFFADHGDMHGSQGQFLKTSPWEEAVRIPCIVGGGVPFYHDIHHRRTNVPLNHVDFAPTTLGLAGFDKPTWMAGTDYSSHVRRDRKPADEPDSALLQLVVPTGHGHSVDRPWRGVVTRDGWKYVCLEHQPWLMFDLNTDPYEQVNLAHNTAHRVRRQALHDRLAAWLRDTGDDFALPSL